MDFMSLKFQVLRAFLALLPRNALSLICGWLARLEFPPLLQSQFNRIFVSAFGLNMGEAELRNPGDYASIEDLFIRRLRPGIRPIESRYVSPADGFLAWSAALAAGQAIQAKGISYSPAQLIWGRESGDNKLAAEKLQWFSTIYLAPHNYHRVHAPISGSVTAIRHIPGDLWPVNLPFVKNFPGLFCANERLVFDIRLSSSEDAESSGSPELTRSAGAVDSPMAYVVLVGAFNVGRIKTHMLPDFATNQTVFRTTGQSTWDFQGQSTSSIDEPMRPPVVAAGDELGAFLLGSTVVVVLDERAASILRPVQASGNRPILMGQSLNYIR